MSRHTLSKRIIAVLLVVTIILTLLPITSTPITVYAETDKVTLTAGDLDGVNGVTIMDVLILLRHIAGKTELTAEQYKAANVNGDTKVDINDLLLMLRYVAGKINSFPSTSSDEEDQTDEIDWDNLQDSDSDGLPDILEDYYGTDKDNPDTDRDGVNDYLEILNGTDPLIYDMDIDYDNDSITNGNEILKYQTDPWNKDTDDDSLTDYEELFTYKTDPLSTDTDNDGMSDGSEIILGLDPLNPDTDGNGITDGEEILTQPVELDSMYELDGLSVVPSIEITGSGDLVRSLYAENIIDNTAVGELPYLVGEPFDFVHDEELEFESSTLRFKLSDDIIAEHDIEDLVIAYYDMDEGVVSFVPTEHDGNSVWAEVEHFSPYFVTSISKYTQETAASNAAYAQSIYNYYEQPTRIEDYGTNGAKQYFYADGNRGVELNGHIYRVCYKKEYSYYMENYGSSVAQNNCATWEEASQLCKDMGGHLFTIDTLEEYSIVSALVTNFAAYYWIENNEFSNKRDTPKQYLQGADRFWSSYYASHAFICEWDSEPNKVPVLLADGTYAYLSKDPEQGDMTVDTDGDGIPDLQELTKKVNIPVNPNRGNEYRTAWGFTTNPAKEDTDGDGLLDGRPLYANEKKVVPKDPEPRKFNGSKEINVKSIWQEQYKQELAGNVQSEFGTLVDSLKAAYNESLTKLMNVVAGVTVVSLITPLTPIPAFDFYYDDKLKALHATNVGAWQRPFGYGDDTDKAFEFFTSGNMRAEKFQFNYNNDEYIIWTWYGDYWNLGSGAEIGFYKKRFSSIDWYVSLDTMPMTLNLYYYYGQNNIQNLFCWAPTKPQWWITGFRPEVKPYADDMVMLGSVDFVGREGMFKALKNKMKENDSQTKKLKDYIIFDDDGHTVWIMWKGEKQ